MTIEYTIIERAPDDFQQLIALEHIIAMCQRAFGEKVQVEAVKELGGGLYNNTYLVRMVGMQPVILRVAPHPARQSRHERHLMRNEHASPPFLAPVARLLPRIIMADFTHQILERDYLFQTYMEGEQWAQVMDTFTVEEKRSLWRQLGSIASKIHTVRGDHFGNAVTGSRFPSWSLAIIDWLTNIIFDLEDAELDATDIRSILDIAQVHSSILDEITQPHLLYGDLWTVNVLVERDKGGPRITAVLDADRTSWGDPLADWTIFLLHRNAGKETDAFWETYGQPEKSLGAQFRSLIYQGRYVGGARLEQHRLHHHDAVRRSYRDVQAILEALSVHTS